MKTVGDRNYYYIFYFLLILLLQPQIIFSKNIIGYIPLDTRPCCEQFPKLIADIADIEILQPDTKNIGNDKRDADFNNILSWIEGADRSKCDAFIVSLDTICYGGLVQSRLNNISQEDAINRIKKCIDVLIAKNKPIYLFGSLTRVPPTYTKENASYYKEIVNALRITYKNKIEKVDRNSNGIQDLLKKIPKHEFESILRMRKRNFKIHKYIVSQLKQKKNLMYVLGQDDAKRLGPHIYESEKLMKMAKSDSISQDRFQYVQGIDQLGCTLLARALFDKYQLNPVIKIMYPNKSVPRLVNKYESIPINESVRKQLDIAGCRVVDNKKLADGFLFVNGKNSSDELLKFLQKVKKYTLNKKLCSIPDLDLDYTNKEKLGSKQTGNQELIKWLMRNEIYPVLAGYDSWNTASNTLGTAIAPLCMEILCRKLNRSCNREAHAKWMLHRALDDTGYLDVVREDARRKASKIGINRYSLSDDMKIQFEQDIREGLKKHLDKLFRENFLNYSVGDNSRLTGIKDIDIRLPWNRTFEVYIDFSFEVR